MRDSVPEPPLVEREPDARTSALPQDAPATFTSAPEGAETSVEPVDPDLDEPRRPRSPVPPVRKLAPSDAPETVAPAPPQAEVPPAEAAEDAGSGRRRLSLSREVRLPSPKRRKSSETASAAKPKDGHASRFTLSRGGGKASKKSADDAGAASKGSRFAIPASLGIHGLKSRDSDGADAVPKERRGSRRLSAPSVASLRSVSLPLHRGRDGGTLVGLDIQPGSAVAVRVSRNGGIHIEDAISVPLAAGVVRDGEVVDSEALGAALHTMFEGSKLSRRVRVGLAGQRCVMRTLEVPPLKDRKELAQAVAFTASQEMPMPLESALTDFHNLGEVETKSGPRERVVFVAAHQEAVGKLLDSLRRAGLTAGGVDLSAFALIRALHRPADDDTPGSQLYLNVDGLTNIAIAEGTTCLFTRVASVGCESMAGELAGARSIPLEEARRELVATNLLDVENTQTLDARTVLRDGLRDVATEVRSALDFHGSQEGPSVTGIVLSGAIAQVRGFADELGQTLGYDVVAREVDAGHANGVGAVAPCRLAVAAGLSVAEVPR